MRYTEEEIEEMYDNMLDECYPEIKIGYIALRPSKVLKECDPTAYRTGLYEYIDTNDIKEG